MARIAALFDMDKTLLDTSSGQLYARYLYRNGQFRRRDLAKVAWWSVLGRLGVLDMQSLVPRLLVQATGDDEGELRRSSDQWFSEDVLPHLSDGGQKRVAEHRRRATWSPSYPVQPSMPWALSRRIWAFRTNTCVPIWRAGMDG